jgi:hypothetical protein
LPAKPSVYPRSKNGDDGASIPPAGGHDGGKSPGRVSRVRPYLFRVRVSIVICFSPIQNRVFSFLFSIPNLDLLSS